MIETPSMTRQRWLELGCATLRARFVELGYKVPDKMRVSIGWPRGSHGKGRAIGQCWSLDASSDKHHEIFISPELGDKISSVRILGVLAHEMVHAVVGVDAGHKRPFKQCAEKIGLTGKMTATEEGPDFVAFSQGIIQAIGKYPAGRLNLSMRKKQSTRLLKCECEACGYTVRVTRKWIEFGAPYCPDLEHGPMACDAVGE